MPKKIRRKTATPPPKPVIGGVIGGQRSPLDNKSTSGSGSIDTLITGNMQQSTIVSPDSVQGTTQSSNRISTWFDNMQNNSRSRSSSPDMESTPRPLHVLKGRKSFLSLHPAIPPRSSTPTPQGFRRKSGSQPQTGPSKGVTTAVARQSPPSRLFLGLRLTSPKPRVLSPVNKTLASCSNMQSVGPKPVEHKPTEARIPHGTALKLPQLSEIDISQQMTNSSATINASSNSFMARSTVSHWMNWRQRSISDGPSIKTRTALIDRVPSRAVQVVHPSVIYESMRHVGSELATPAQTIHPTRKLRHALSIGPSLLSLGQGVPSLMPNRPLTPRPTTLNNIEGPKSKRVEIGEKGGVLSKVLCSIQDMSPLNGNRARGTISTTRSARQPMEAGGEASFIEECLAIAGRDSLAEPPLPLERTKSKSSFRARGALGSIRRRFGSGSVKNSGVPEKEISNIVERSCYKNAWNTSPVLKCQLNIHSESTREHVEGGTEFWVCIEVEGRVTNFQTCERNLKGMDIAIVLDLSAYASPATFEETKSMAKHLINSLSEGDNVGLTAFTSIQSSPGIETKYPLSRLTPTNKQQIFGFIDGLFGKVERQSTIRQDVKAIIMAVIDDLKESKSDQASNGNRRTGHLFLLTSSLRQGDLPMGALDSSDRKVKVHIIGVGPLVTIQERPRKGGWAMSLSPSPINESPGPRPGNSSAFQKRIPTLPQILDSLRCSMEFGELTHIRIGLNPCDGCKIMEVLGDAAFEKLVPGEKRTLLVKLKIGPYKPASAPGTSLNTPDKTKVHQTNSTPKGISVNSALNALDNDRLNDDQTQIREYKVLERQLAATLGDIESKILTVSVSYEHEYFGVETVIITKKDLIIQRFDGDGNWSLSRNTTVGSLREQCKRNSGDSMDSGESLLRPGSDNLKLSDSSNGDVEYVRTMLARKIAEMTIGQAEENPRKALKTVEDWGIRGKGVHAVASELEWRIRIQEEEEETERTMKGLAVELLKAAEQPWSNADRKSADFAQDTLSKATSIRSYSTDMIDNPRSTALAAASYNHSVSTGSTEALDAIGRNKEKGKVPLGRPRVSSIVIHPVTSGDQSSSPASVSETSDESDLDVEDTHSAEGLRASAFKLQTGWGGRDHTDEAGRIWRELAETKMGLRRDVRPGRYRTPTLAPLSRHSRHNSTDFLREKHEKERISDMDWVSLTPSRVKDKQKERRRRKRKQAMKRRSMNGDGGLKGGQTVNEEVAVASSSEIRVRNRAFLAGTDSSNINTEDTQDLVEVESGNGHHENRAQLLIQGRQDGTEDVATYEQSNRDTMKSLITLRDVKETNFSPWAC